MTLDSTYFKEIGLNTELSSLYSTLLKYYDEPEEMIEINTDRLSISILNIIKKDELELKKNAWELNITYHRISYLLSFYLNQSKSLRCLKRQIAMGSIIFLLNNFSDKEINLTNNINELINKLRPLCQTLFNKSSYAMYNLVEYLNIIIDDLMMNVASNKNNVVLVEILKTIVVESNRQVREALERKGCSQVKVMITNFVYKCDYYLKAHSEKHSVKPLSRLNRHHNGDDMNTTSNYQNSMFTDKNFINSLLGCDNVSMRENEDPNETSFFNSSHLAFL
ncbi:unnamed protein product [Brachionus calyciflorus]|uniref:Uncharacterized protein n=1 Tax=Brachionus calyciflorus TaxID=104777 RepID=A0A814FFD0_9BILA|nr:unnamed protein product [Brachionus calyciflorus]